MIKTQVQIPDHLFREAKRIASEYEMSFAEVVRRGIERLSAAYPPRSTDAAWKIPKPRRLGWKGLTNAQLKEQAQMTSFEENLAVHRRGKRTQ